MKSILLMFIIFFSSHIAACDEEVSISYAPFVSLLTVTQVFDDLHSSLEKETGCYVSYKLYKSFDLFIDDVINKKSTFSVVPASYVAALKLLGYEFVAEVEHENHKAKVIVNRSSAIKSIDDLMGRSIMLISPFSESGARFIDVLDRKDMLTQVRLDYGGNYESMVFGVMRGKADAAVIIPHYWDLLDTRIRTRHLKVIGEVELGVGGFVMLPGNDHLVGPLLNSLKKNKIIKWGAPKGHINTLPSLQAYMMKRANEILKK